MNRKMSKQSVETKLKYAMEQRQRERKNYLRIKLKFELKYIKKQEQNIHEKIKPKINIFSPNRTRYKYQRKTIKNHKAYLNNKKKYQYNRW